MIKKNQLLSSYTTFKIGGPADYFCEAKDEKEILSALKFAQKKKIPLFILGNGSNVLISDKGLRGMVVKIANSKYQIVKSKIVAGAGMGLNKLVDIAKENELTGLEFLAGIPGTLGGAIVSNAGAWQQNIGDKVERVKILDENNQFKWLNHEECQFSYRRSRFKKTKEVILEVELKLTKGKRQEIEREIKINLKKRKNQPKEPSAGSIFINPKPLSAGALIEECGLKGEKRGSAQISEKHANFMVNLGGAKASDVVELMALARRKVKEKFNILLEPEINFLGEFDDQISN